MPRSEYEYIKKRLLVKVCNADRHQEMLKNMVHERRGELALVCHLKDLNEESRQYHRAVTEGHMKGWGVDAKTLLEDAFENMKEQYEPILVSVEEGLISWPDTPNLLDDDVSKYGQAAPNQLYALTNRDTLYGAVYMLDDQIMQKVSEKLGGDLYILPSSTDEVMIIRMDGRGSKEQLKEMLLLCNMDTELIPDSIFLSNELYHYDSEKHTLSIVPIPVQKLERAPENGSHDEEEGMSQSMI